MTINQSSNSFDVVIIGAGIAGSLLTKLLSAASLNVLLIDNSKPPPLKLAESLPDTVNPMLERLGISHLLHTPLHKPSSGYNILWGNETLSEKSFDHTQNQSGWKVDKSALIADIQASSPYGSLIKNTINKVSPSATGFNLSIGPAHDMVKTRFIVDTSGRRAWLTKQLSIGNHKFDQLLAFVVNVPRKQHPHIKHPVFVEAMNHGWGLVSKINDKENLLALFTNRQADNFNQYKKLPQWHNLCQHSHYFKHFIPNNNNYPVHSVDANSRIANRLYGENWLLAGDAAMSFDPLSSHGMTTAMYMAEKASVAIVQYFNGAPEYLKQYAKQMTGIYNSYLNELVSYYQRETRWPEANFWRSKQRISIAGEGPVKVV